MTAAHPARRRFLRNCGTLVVMALAPLRALAAQWNKAAFDARAIDESLKQIGAMSIAESDQVLLKAPEIAENGAIVPLEITSRLPDTRTVYILVEKNPQPLAASFDFADGIEPFIATRIKMNESSRLRIVVKAGGKFYGTVREVKVTIGGCGA